MLINDTQFSVRSVQMLDKTSIGFHCHQERDIGNKHTARRN